MAMKVAQQFYLLQQGRVTFSGTPDQLAEDDVVQRAYLAAHSTHTAQAA
jgi:branched-chain amino acid transport system ATP-binding protein